MINYATTRELETLGPSRMIDVLADVKKDVSGASNMLYAAADSGEIEPAGVSLIADSLLLAADALGAVVDQLESAGRGLTIGDAMELIRATPEGRYELDTYEGVKSFNTFDEAARYLADFDKLQRKGARAFFNATPEHGELFQQYELDAYLGDFAKDYDIGAIIDEATVIVGGNRYWKSDVDLGEICERHENGAQ